MISWECRDEVKIENKVKIRTMCFIFKICDLAFDILLKFDFVALAATGFYFFYRKKSKQKNSQSKKLTLTFVLASKISLLYLVVFS